MLLPEVFYIKQTVMVELTVAVDGLVITRIRYKILRVYHMFTCVTRIISEDFFLSPPIFAVFEFAVKPDDGDFMPFFVRRKAV